MLSGVHTLNRASLPIKHDYGMCPWNDGFGDFGEVFIHRLRIGKGHTPL